MNDVVEEGPQVKIERVLGRVGTGDPCVVFFGGVHGNEPAGVRALQQVFSELKAEDVRKGSAIALIGNIGAYEQHVRMRHTDLNRVWSGSRPERDLEHGPLRTELGDEAEEFHALNRMIQDLLKTHRELYFIDLHTTSAPTAPFVTMSDTLVNRDFVRGSGLPVILGIEEYLHGPLLSWLMERGHVALAFESGQHDDPASLDLHARFVRMTLDRVGVIRGNQDRYAIHVSDPLKDAVFDVRLREPLMPGDDFRMHPGYRNFDPVSKGTEVAVRNGVPVQVALTGNIFMPLYQRQGSEGFFLIRRISRFWLWLSKWIRLSGMQGLLTYLPGVNAVPKEPRRLQVDTRTAFAATVKVFHLFGYRLEDRDGDRLHFIRREQDRRRRP
ncbi:MAG: succinylglutamate desuccinylase/aspartoacylase family protein [Flavobacteriales bacterium]|nr:succinylglutamate desuccinylase/aspartoacylase family protein [Flavobacteriales bacterium]